MSTREITEQVEDALTYPILTQQVDGQQPSTHAAQGVSVATGGSLDSIAQSTIRRVLGWRYRANETKGFTAALTKTFALNEVEGHVEWEWKPQNYMVQADLGEVTGAQASIYTRAKAAIDQALPLLDGLTPLREDADPEDCEAIRALVRSELKDQLVPELGKPGGPVVQLVQQVFTLLLGSGTPISNLEMVGGQLGELRFRFGLERKRVNTVAEEVNLTNFLIVVDYINSLFITWIAQADFLGRQNGAEPFLGTQLVFLSQQLEEVAETSRASNDSIEVPWTAVHYSSRAFSLGGEICHSGWSSMAPGFRQRRSKPCRDHSRATISLSESGEPKIQIGIEQPDARLPHRACPQGIRRHSRRFADHFRLGEPDKNGGPAEAA
jgi:hypothetical protein